jgi:nucleotide-binding universal stress UspA family protein
MKSRRPHNRRHSADHGFFEAGATRLCRTGSPVEVILDQAKCGTADPILMRTHGHRGVERLVLGSVTESIVRRAGCPVLVVKAR